MMRVVSSESSGSQRIGRGPN